MGARSGDTICNKTKQRRFEDVSSKRIRHSNTQCNNNQRVLGIVPRLNRVIPCVERLKERANNAGQQDKCDGYSRRAGSHRFEYSVSVSQRRRQNDVDINRRVFMVRAKWRERRHFEPATFSVDGQPRPSRRLIRIHLQIRKLRRGRVTMPNKRVRRDFTLSMAERLAVIFRGTVFLLPGTCRRRCASRPP